ncbi:AlpA family phage regulatory protein [Paraburkholderia sp. BL9I2N2]|uniref:helix-turn-helix transcriptional regulator n=1 Tax=Paraburkholderia sp. BL9I2N2 TaxID=1938809 RepID=UPI00104F7E91|nr:AlpA family phage regulatory protein [Paraburkholderia sp. BL9I2N2]TCK95572.1 AlpA family transcriptional regulator [Paraburkholderia sp. BL9I2N2]
MNAMDSTKHTRNWPRFSAASAILSPPASGSVSERSASGKEAAKSSDVPPSLRSRTAHDVSHAHIKSEERATIDAKLACDRILRLPELMAILQISRTVVYDLQKKGVLPHSVRIGSRSVGWKLSEIERFVASLGTEAQ